MIVETSCIFPNIESGSYVYSLFGQMEHDFDTMLRMNNREIKQTKENNQRMTEWTQSGVVRYCLIRKTDLLDVDLHINTSRHFPFKCSRGVWWRSDKRPIWIQYSVISGFFHLKAFSNDDDGAEKQITPGWAQHFSFSNSSSA